MSDTQSYHVIGDPVAQGRARAFTRPGMKGVRFYDPQESKNWKMDVRHEVLRQGAVKIEGPVALSLSFYLPRPKYIKDKTVPHVKKPDLDNLAKAIKDALKGVCWDDDSQVMRLTVSKQYADPLAPGATGVHILLERGTV